MNAIIFGGCGFIGIHFAEHLLLNRKFKKIFLADLTEPKDIFLLSIYKNLLKENKIEYVKIDVREKIDNNKFFDISLIVDFAAIHREPGHEEKEYFETNNNGSYNICNFAKKINSNNIIFSSSISTYGTRNIRKDENTKTEPSTPYGKSKLLAEKNYINWQKNENQKRILTICRPGVVFGPGENGNVTRLIKTIKKKRFIFTGNKTLKKGGIYVKELIHSLTWTNENQLKKKFNNIVIYNGVFYPCPTIEDYVNEICATLKIKNNFLSISKKLIKFIILISSFITKKLNPKSNFHFTRLNKLFNSNNIHPFFLIKNNYQFNYDLKKSMENWKILNDSDWSM